jgi:hypothetical protein
MEVDVLKIYKQTHDKHGNLIVKRKQKKKPIEPIALCEKLKLKIIVNDICKVLNNNKEIK